VQRLGCRELGLSSTWVVQHLPFGQGLTSQDRCELMARRRWRTVLAIQNTRCACEKLLNWGIK
jgi:hypothetical protein